MNKLLKKYNINIKFESMPKNVLGIYVDVLGQPYILLNDILHTDMHEFICYACLYFKDNNTVGKITMNDLENINYEPFKYARRRMRDSVVC